MPVTVETDVLRGACRRCFQDGRVAPTLVTVAGFHVEMRTGRFAKVRGADLGTERAIFEYLDGGKRAILVCPHQSCRSQRSGRRRQVQVTAGLVRRLAGDAVDGVFYL